MSLLLDLPGLALVAGCLVLGLGLAAGGPPWLTAGERVVIGLVLAVVAQTMLGYVVALATGVTVGLILLLALVSLGAGGFLLWRHGAPYRFPAFPSRSGAPYRLPAFPRRSGAPYRLPAFPRRSGAPFALPALLVALALALAYLFARAVEVTPDAWIAHYNNTWSDWSFHASYTTAFVYGHNLPPQNPIFSGTPFRYTFGPDFFSALLIGGGWSIAAALTWPSWKERGSIKSGSPWLG